jgi:hypothetical protein
LEGHTISDPPMHVYTGRFLSNCCVKNPCSSFRSSCDSIFL